MALFFRSNFLMVLNSWSLSREEANEDGHALGVISMLLISHSSLIKMGDGHSASVSFLTQPWQCWGFNVLKLSVLLEPELGTSLLGEWRCGCNNALEKVQSLKSSLQPLPPCPNRNAQSQRLFLYNCLYKFNKGKTASGRSTKTTPYNNGTYECRILQSGNNHVINLKWELNSHFKERETTFDHLFYCWTHCIN